MPASDSTSDTSTKAQITKSDTIAKFQRSGSDVGSPEVQVALLTRRIEVLSSHFEKHKEDVHSRQGMLRLVSRRKKLLSYLKSTQLDRYKETIGTLGLRK